MATECFRYTKTPHPYFKNCTYWVWIAYNPQQDTYFFIYKKAHLKKYKQQNAKYNIKIYKIPYPQYKALFY